MPIQSERRDHVDDQREEIAAARDCRGAGGGGRPVVVVRGRGAIAADDRHRGRNANDGAVPVGWDCSSRQERYPSMTEIVIPHESSPISLSLYTGLRRRQVRNALQNVHPVLNPARPKDEQAERQAPKARSRPARPSLPQTLVRMRRTPARGVDRKVKRLTPHRCAVCIRTRHSNNQQPKLLFS